MLAFLHRYINVAKVTLPLVPFSKTVYFESHVLKSYFSDWLAAIHEVAEVAGKRVYEHRFVMFDESEWSIRAVSPPFAFRETQAIEFAAGLAVDDGRVLVTFGVRDAEAWMADLALCDVLGLMGAP